MNDEILSRIKALRSKVAENGATEAEAMSALAAAEKLMQKHGVTEGDLRNVEFKRDMKYAEFEQRQKADHPSQKYCDTTIAMFCATKVWANRTPHGKKITSIFGFKGDVEMHSFLLGLIHDSMDRGWKHYLANNPKREGVTRHTEYWSFMSEFARRVNQKIRSLMDERAPEVKSETGTDLVEKKNDLVQQAYDELIGVPMRNGRGGSIRTDMSARLQGALAGDKVNIQRPIRQQETKGQKKIS